MSGRASAALDAAGRGAELVRRLPAWVGILVLTALPARLLLAYLVWQAWRLGAAAGQHGDALHALALLTLGAWVVAQIGRQFFVRACTLDLDGGRSSATTVLRVPFTTLVSAVWLALLLELVFWCTLPLVAPAVVALLVSGVAAACVGEGVTGLVAPLRRLTGVFRSLPHLILGLGFLLAFVLALINLHLLVRGLLWAAEGVAGFDLAHWQAVLSPLQPLYWMQLVVGASLVLEPFWLAASVVEVRQARSRRSGEDLRQWFGDLMTRAGA